MSSYEIVSHDCESYNKIVKKTVRKDIPVKKYIFPKSTRSIQLEGKDLTNFKLLYKQNGGNQTIGFGEIALYWLFGGKLKPAGDIDLMQGKHKIDVKSYAEGRFITLGKWKDNIKTRQIVNTLFACYNLMNIGRDGKFKSELNFNTTHVEEAIRANIELHHDINNIDPISSNMSDVKRTLEYVVEDFKALSKTREREFLEPTNDNIDKIVEESVADLIYGLVHYKLFESTSGIGTDGYIINVVKAGNGISGMINIHRTKGISKDAKILLKNFAVHSGEINIKTDILL